MFITVILFIIIHKAYDKTKKLSSFVKGTHLTG